MTPFVSIICPIYNEEKYISKCIDSILSQDFPKERMEVFFVDGMSTDKTREIIKEYSSEFPYLKILDNPQKTVPYAMNIGIKNAKGDIIVRLDAHAAFPSNYISRLIEVLFSLNADNVGGVCRTLPANDKLKSKSIAIALSSAFGMGNSYFRIGSQTIKKVDTVPFGCFKRETFDKIGLFDEELVRNQDDEFNGRLINNGGSIYLIPDLVIDYVARDTFKKTYKMFFQYGLFKPLVNKKLGKPATIRQFFPMLFVGGLFVGGILSFISKYFLFAYITILLCYIEISLFFSFKESFKNKNWKLFFLLPYTFFIIHFAYGVGYWKGIWNIIFNKKFNVNTSR